MPQKRNLETMGLEVLFDPIYRIEVLASITGGGGEARGSVQILT